jgi:Zn ribbon nucleic-acid-binding protein
MCLRRAPEKYIAGAKAPVGAALDRAALDYKNILERGCIKPGFLDLGTS